MRREGAVDLAIAPPLLLAKLFKIIRRLRHRSIGFSSDAL